MKKRLLATLLCLIMVIVLLPTMAFAQNAASVWIAGAELTSATPYYYNNGTVSATDTGYNAYYNTATGVLTLNGLTVIDSTATKSLTVNNVNTTFKYAVCADGDLTLNLISNSVVSTANTINGNENVALGVNGNLTIKGTGSLNATAGGASGGDDAYSAGVDVVGTLTASEGTLTGNAGAASGSEEGFSAGIYVQNDLNISGGSVSGTGSTTTSDLESYSTGIYVQNNLNVSANASLTGNGGAATGDYSESYGVWAQSALNISGGTINATAATATGNNDSAYSQGIGAYGEFTVSGGTINAIAGEAAVQSGGSGYALSYGIYTQAENIVFSGGNVTATGGKAKHESYGVTNSGVYDYNTEWYSGGSITISGTAIVHATGGTASGSFGLWCLGNPEESGLDVSGGGTLTAEGGTADDNSYGIYARTGDADFNGNEVKAIGGEAANLSYGVYSEDMYSAIRVSGGIFTAKSISINAITKKALNKVLTRENGIKAKGSALSNGSNPVEYVDNDNRNYMWVSAFNTHSLTVDKNPANSVNIGNTVTLTATPNDIVAPTYQWYSNVQNNTTNASLINGATAVTYTPPTTSAGTIYYYCVANGSTISNIVGVTVLPSANTVAMPTFSPAGGTYTSAQSVTLSCPTPGASIHYTTNGTEPTESSPVFVPEISIPVPSTMTIKAKAFKDGMMTSETASATYTITQPITGRSISVLPSANGSVTSNKQSAGSGETVTLTVTPKDGYKLKSLLILDAFGNDCVQEGFITLSGNQFVMPDMALTVMATFEKINADGLTDEIASMSGTIQFENEVPDDCTLDIRPGALPVSFTAEEGETARLFEISVFRNNQPYPISENDMSVTIALTNDLLGLDNYRISYLNNENQLVETQDATVNGEYLQFTTNHLGNYIVEAGNDPSHTHSFEDKWKFDTTNHWHECACGEKSGTAAHTFGDWTITKSATATEKGIKERSCSVCGYKETAVIAATSTSPKTGDTGNLSFRIALILISVGILTVFGFAKRNRRKVSER